MSIGLGLLEPLSADPEGSALLVDFDGTISPIVVEPALAGPLPEAVELLHLLAGIYGLVAVVSGRPAAFLVSQLDLAGRNGRMVAVGLYGMEQSLPDGSVESLAGESWRPVVAEAVVAALAGAPPDVLVEEKGLSVALHWREAVARGAGGDVVEAATRLAAELATMFGLELRHGRMSAELLPPVRADKGVAVERLCRGRSGALYAGDDLGDLPAFAALDALAAGVGAGSSPFYAVKVAVASDEAPPVLLAAADLVVAGPPGMVELLRSLVPLARKPRPATPDG